LRLDRHRPRLPAERLRRAGKTGQGDQALMSAPGAVKAARVYVEAGVADAFAACFSPMACPSRARRPSPPASSAATWAASARTGLAACRGTSTDFGAA